jgi:hypothetical protein
MSRIRPSPQPLSYLYPVSSALPVPFAYEERLAGDFQYALSEGSMHFEKKSAVQGTLQKITERLNDLNIDYAVAGGMALFSHGLRRFTEDVDILITREGLKTVHQNLEGRGYLPLFNGSKNLRDTEHGVRIEFLIAGEFPGDGKPKPVVFPDPQSVALERDGIKYLNLPSLIELKLASGMTSLNRLKDLADVQELIKLLGLSQDFEVNLNPYVRERYRELWTSTQEMSRCFVRIWHDPHLSVQVNSLEELIAAQPGDVTTLQEMHQDGITLDLVQSRPEEGYFVLTTTDPVVAQRHGLHDAAEFWSEDHS